MARVTGIGGVFIAAKDATAMRRWYHDHLGIDVQPWGGTTFPWSTPEHSAPEGETVWSVFDASAAPFAPSTAPFMVNYRVDDLGEVLDALRSEGCDVEERTEASEYGRFGWVIDPEGNKVELWEPPPGLAAD